MRELWYTSSRRASRMIGLSLQQRSDQQAVLEELHGSQRYFLDYLMLDASWSY